MNALDTPRRSMIVLSRSAQTMAIAMFAFVGMSAIAVRLAHGPSLWPDVGCQTYLGWRLAAGDMLYSTVWDSHPPAAALYAAIFHLIAPPSDTLVVFMFVTSAALYSGASMLLLRTALGRPFAAALAATLVLAGYYLLAFAGLRSEDLIAISASWTVVIVLLGTRSHRGLAYMAAAGIVSGVGLLAKPAGASAVLVGCLLIASAGHLASRLRSLVYFLAGTCALPVLTLAWLAATGSIGAAWDGIVTYGRSYFRTYSLEVAGQFIHHVMYGPSTFALLVLVLVAPLRRHWLPTLLNWWPPHTRERAFWVVFVIWPALDGLAIQPQTTMFQYVVHPLGLTSLTLAAVAVVSFFAQLRTEDISTADLAHALVRSLTTLTCFVAAGTWMWTVTHPSSPVPPSVPTLLGFCTTLALLATLAHHERALASLPSTFAKRILAVGLVLTLAWGITFMPFVSEWKRVRLRTLIERPYRESPMYQLASALRSLDVAQHGGAAWYDIAPSLYYLAQLEQPVREYLSAPLFLDGYATEAAWSRHADQLVRANPAMIFEWTEWFSFGAARPHLERFEGYKRALRFISERYTPIGDSFPYSGRGALRIHVRGDLFDTLGCASQQAMAALLKPVEGDATSTLACP